MKEIDVLNVLKNVIDPDIKKDLVTLKMIENIKVNKDKVNFDREITVREIIVRSSNVGSARIALKLGKEMIKIQINFHLIFHISAIN